MGSSAFAQGVVSFANLWTYTLISTNSVIGGPSAGYTSGPVGSYYYGLFIAPTTQTNVDASFAGWTFTGNYATNTDTPGRLWGNYTTDPGVVIAAMPPGNVRNFLVVGWSANIGHDWPTAQVWYDQALLGDNAFTGWFGVSSVAQYVTIGGGPISVPTIFGSGADRVGGFSLYRMDPVPEPSVSRLLVLVLSVLVILHGRRSIGCQTAVR